MNSTYGYTLLKYDSKNYKTLIVRSRRNLSNLKVDRYEPLGKTIYGAPNYVLLQQKRKYAYSHNLCEIGSAILWYSKLIFFKAIYHVLSHANPSRLSIAYQDTDSIHLLMAYDTIEECIWPELFDSWTNKYDEFFGTKKHFSGTLIIENSVTAAYYWSEKCYTLGNRILHFKSIPNRYHYLIQSNVNFNDQISYTSINKSELYGIVMSQKSKIVKSLIIPKKRYFLSEKYSIPLSLNQINEAVDDAITINPTGKISFIK